MVGLQWLPWINNPTPGTISMTSTKQEQELSSDSFSTRKKVTGHHLCPVIALSALCLLLLVTCVALAVLYNESDSKAEWKSLLFDYQNVSDSYLTLSKANNELKGDNELLHERSSWLNEQTEHLNRTSAELMSTNLALSLESTHLTEQIVNLTSANSQLMQEYDQLVQRSSEEEEKKLNMSQTIRYLVLSNTQLQEEKHRVKEKNQELLEINDRFQREIQNLSEKMGTFLRDDCEKASKHSMQLQDAVTQLQEEKQNMSVMLFAERQEAAEQLSSRRKEMDQMEADMQSMNQACLSLDLYCPVVNQKTKERICRTCPDSWRLFQTKCYFFSSRLLTWSSSRAWCQTQGADLLIINSEPEQTFIYDTSQAEEAGGRLWIGMTDAEKEGDWCWVDGSKVTADVQYWLSRPGTENEPDNWKLDDPQGEDCGHIDTSENTLRSWMDGSCKTPYRWICEKDV